MVTSKPDVASTSRSMDRGVEFMYTRYVWIMLTSSVILTDGFETWVVAYVDVLLILLEKIPSLTFPRANSRLALCRRTLAACQSLSGSP